MMNIREIFLKSPVLQKQDEIKIVEYATSSKKNFDELMKYFLQDEHHLRLHAARCVSLAAQKNSRFVEPYIPDLIQQLSRKDASNSLLRNSLRLLQNAQIPEKYIGETTNACYAFLENNSSPVAIKVFAMTVLGNIARSVPEIKNDLKMLIDFQMENASAGYKARAKQVLRNMK